MEYVAFEELVAKVKKENPILFELDHDEMPDEKSLEMFQIENNIKLPRKYSDFLMGFGGGYFGYTNIYSIDRKSEFYIMSNQGYVPDNYLAIADNGCGDCYVLLKNSDCIEKIYLLEHESGKLYEVARDILEFFVKYGLRKEL